VHFVTCIKEQNETWIVIIFPFIVCNLVIEVCFVVDSPTDIEHVIINPIVMLYERSNLSYAVSVPFLQFITCWKAHCEDTGSYRCDIKVELFISYMLRLPHIFFYNIFQLFHFVFKIKYYN